MRLNSLAATLACLGCLSVLPGTVMADAPDANAKNKQEMTESDADKLVQRGREEMAASNEDSSRSVDAAVDFSKALKYYEKVGNDEKTFDLKANIFWCKKRMSLDEINKFRLAKHGDSASIDEALKTVDAVVTKEVPKEEAANYYARAEKYAKDHPSDYEQVAAHYFEVAERFVGTDISLKAQKQSMAAQQQQVAALNSEKEKERETLFTKPVEAGNGNRAKIPSADEIKDARVQVHNLYKADFGQSKASKKRRLLAKLMAQVPSSKDDPTTLYVLLTDSIDLASQVGDWYSVMAACDSLAQDFDGVDAKAKKKEICGKFKNNQTVQSILKLLDNPDDGDANLVVGKFFWFECSMTDVGMKMLAHGTDPDMKSTAAMEILKPAGTAQQIQLADKWYALGKKSRPPGREAMLSRAFNWYKTALPSSQGVSKDKLTARIDEIDGLLPMTNLNYDELTPKQWERLKGDVVEVIAGKDHNDSGYVLAAGMRVRVVPNPTDTWSIDYWDAPADLNWKGERPGGGGADHSWNYHSGDLRVGAMVMFVENGQPRKPGIIEGEGRLFLGPYSNGWGSGGQGMIRAKIVTVSDDE